jgi:hypothetical protein
MAQVVEGLPSTHKALNSIPSTKKKKQQLSIKNPMWQKCFSKVRDKTFPDEQKLREFIITRSVS